MTAWFLIITMVIGDKYMSTHVFMSLTEAQCKTAAYTGNEEAGKKGMLITYKCERVK